MKDDTRKHTHRRTAPEEGFSATSLPVGVPQTCLPCATGVKHSKNEIWGLCYSSSGADPSPDRAVTTTEQRGAPQAQYPGQALVTTPANPPYQGGNGQHTLRKEVANIHTENSPLTKQRAHTHTHTHVKSSPLRLSEGLEWGGRTANI